MNPIIVFFLFMLLYQENNRFPNYFNTFRLEQLLEKLNYTVSSLDRINHLNEIAHQPLEKGKIVHTIEDSIHTVKPLFPDGKPQQHLDTIESIMSSFKKIGGLQNMAKSLGPVMQLLSAMPENGLLGGEGSYSSELDYNGDSDYGDKSDYNDEYDYGDKSEYNDEYDYGDKSDYSDEEYAASLKAYGNVNSSDDEYYRRDKSGRG